MLLIRDVFRCKPGRAKDLVERFKKMTAAVKKQNPDAGATRVMVDAVSTYWTVVFESEVEDLATFERQMAEYGSNQEMRDAMGNYMELVDGGYREVFRIV